MTRPACCTQRNNLYREAIEKRSKECAPFGEFNVNKQVPQLINWQYEY